MRIVLALLTLLVTLGAASAQSLANRTQMSFSPGHGTQIEYLAADGTAWLWYPGNRVILQGAWKTEVGSMCFRYGANTFNPVTGHTGAGWECAPLAIYRSTLTESRTGDLLGLKGRGKVPYALGSTRVDLDSVVRKVTGKAPPKGTKNDAAKADESAPPKKLTTADAKAVCADIIARRNGSKQDKRRAAQVYFHGQHMGVRCVEVDYLLAVRLARESGFGSAAFEKILVERAEGGSPKAIAALEKLGYRQRTN